MYHLVCMSSVCFPMLGIVHEKVYLMSILEHKPNIFAQPVVILPFFKGGSCHSSICSAQGREDGWPPVCSHLATGCIFPPEYKQLTCTPEAENSFVRFALYMNVLELLIAICVSASLLSPSRNTQLCPPEEKPHTKARLLVIRQPDSAHVALQNPNVPSSAKIYSNTFTKPRGMQNLRNALAINQFKFRNL